MWVVLVSNKGGGEEVMVAAGTLSVSCVVCLAIASNDARTPLTEWGGNKGHKQAAYKCRGAK